MHGDVAYCKKNGHDYTIMQSWTDSNGIRFWYQICEICGKRIVTSLWKLETEEKE